nr:hypothetical protein [Bdellovibrionales bacterium]
RNSPIIILKTDHESRLKNIYEEYVLPADFSSLSYSLQRIAKKLGGDRYKEVSEELKSAFEKPKSLDHHAGWITALLRYYYDPFYERDIKKNAHQMIFSGTALEISEFINERLTKEN